jgi:hypothetical protein
MSEIEYDPWLKDACECVEKSMLDGLYEKGTRYLMMRETILRGRKGALHYGNDRLVGFLHGLVNSLWLLGVRHDLLKFGEVPYPSRYFGDKRWDYLLEDPSGRPVMRIEMKSVTIRGPTSTNALIKEMPAILGMAYDHRASGQDCFAGLVLVHRARTGAETVKKRKAPVHWERPDVTAHWAAKRREKARMFLDQLRAGGLIDAAVFYEEDGGSLVQPFADATTSTFLNALRDVIGRHPALIQPWRFVLDRSLPASAG